MTIKSIKRRIETAFWQCTGLVLLSAATAPAQDGADAAGPAFSEHRGFYREAFELTITAPANADIKYTLDGSDPRTSATAERVATPFALDVNPLDFSRRDRSPAVVVRAAVANKPFVKVETHTYLFVERIRHLSPDGRAPGPRWAPPDNKGQTIDYGLDPDVLNDPRYADQIEAAFLAVPTFAISTAIDNLFDERRGIYLNATKRGRLWERPASVELLHPDGAEGFQVDAGLRIRGGFSRNDFNPKHAFRLFFRSEYGAAKLRYPLFGAGGADRFDKIDLRTSQNYAWSNSPAAGDLNLMNRDVFSRDAQGEMGRPHTRSEYYHLFLNGVYWGLFQTQERAEAAFAATYFGGERADYDVVKVDPSEFRWVIEATDGDLESWRRVFELTQQGFADGANYHRLQGQNPDGSRNPDYDIMVDVGNLIDYMLVVFYGGNFDAPVSKFLGNKKPNNFFAIYDRRGGAGFRFFAHDAEHTLLTVPTFVGSGLEEDRVNIGAAGGQERMTVSAFENFHPQWLHHRLSEHPDYRMRFAAHVQRHFFAGGALTPERSEARFLRRARQIEQAIIAESARWGDAHSPQARTQADWQRGIEHLVDNYFPVRRDIVLRQLQNARLYPTLRGPELSAAGAAEGVREVAAGTRVVIANPNDRGRIAYTLDGSDPRLPGGRLSPAAQTAQTEAALMVSETIAIAARILAGASDAQSGPEAWSTQRQLTLVVAADLSGVRVSEIHYNPLPSEDFAARDLEFVELLNVGDQAADLSFAAFTDGIDYVFPAGSRLAPGRRLVLAADARAFAARYGTAPFGEFAGQLDNGGERLALDTAAGAAIVAFTYDDDDDWPQRADGDGFSLVLKEGHGPDLSSARQWRGSDRLHGTPGGAETSTAVARETGTPVPYRLRGNWPNPFNARTVIAFDAPGAAPVHLVIHDVLGRVVRTLHRGETLAAGSHRRAWDGLDDWGRPVASGVYLYRLAGADGFSAVGRMAVIR